MTCERKHIEAISADIDRIIAVLGDPAGHISDEETACRLIAINADHSVQIALAACDESPWRSMESAPKDGKYILIRHGDWVPDIAGWRDERPARPGVMAVPPGWFTVAGPRSRILEPTHWMPLPAAPEGKL